MCSTDMLNIDCEFIRNISDWNVAQYVPEFVVPMVSVLRSFEYHPWVFAVIGSTLVGLSGILPLLVIPIEEGANLKSGAGSQSLRVLLSFAVGCLLGDVFLHLLPEVWGQHIEIDPETGHPSMSKGLWVLAGLLVFIILEKVFSSFPDEVDMEIPKTEVSTKQSNGYILNNNVKEACNGYANGHVPAMKTKQSPLEDKIYPVKPSSIKVSGYLNLMANSFDNFTHGLAVGGSFLVSFPHGVLTTLAILLHEIPHEVGDFAILLKSGFTRWDAARAQLATATTGVMGALSAVMLSGATTTVEARTSWIMPFTSGGFLHIALVTVLPDLLQEKNPKESMLQMLSLLGGIVLMAGLIALGE